MGLFSPHPIIRAPGDGLFRFAGGDGPGIGAPGSASAAMLYDQALPAGVRRGRAATALGRARRVRKDWDLRGLRPVVFAGARLGNRCNGSYYSD